MAQGTASSWRLLGADGPLGTHAALASVVRSTRNRSRRTWIHGLDPSLAEGILDVVVALRLAHRDGQVVVAAPGLAPLLGSEAKEVLLAQLRSVDLQSRRLIDGARRGGLTPGWQHTDLELLEAQGRSGKGAIPAMVQAIRQVPELAARLGQPSARFLDVGWGSG